MPLPLRSPCPGLERHEQVHEYEGKDYEDRESQLSVKNEWINSKDVEVWWET